MNYSNFNNKKVRYNILYVVPSMNSGGVEKNVVEVANHLINKNIGIYILTSEAKMKNLLDTRIKIIYKNIKTKNFFKIFLNSFYIKDLCRKLDIDILHVKSRSVAWSVKLAFNKKSRKFPKIVSTFHGIYECSSHFKHKYSSAMSFGDKIISVSNYVTQYILNNYNVEEKLTTINRGIDIDKYSVKNVTKSRLFQMAKILGIEDNTKRVIFFPGRFSKIKGQKFLIDVISKIKSENFICILAGDIEKNPTLVKEILEKIKKYNLEEKVKIIDNVSDIQAAYLLSHVILSISNKAESFGRIPIEAGAMGRPTIVTNLGEIKNNVIHKKTGWIVESENSEDMQKILEEAIEISLEDWQEMCIYARKYVEKYFNINNMLQRTEEIYESLFN